MVRCRGVGLVASTVLTHYYHIYAVGDWRRIVDEHLTALEEGGLAVALHAFRVGIVGDTREREAVCAHLRSFWPRAEVVAEAGSGWEQITLGPLWHAAQAGEHAQVLYAHTKGAANPCERSEQWRRGMTLHLVREWRTAAGLLDRADAVGVHRIDDHVWPHEVPHWVGISPTRRISEQLHRETDGAYPFDPDDPQWDDEPKPIHTRIHFSGNFWWSTMDWIRQLPLPLNRTRFDAENWIGCIKPPRLIDLQPGSPFNVYPPGTGNYPDQVLHPTVNNHQETKP